MRTSAPLSSVTPSCAFSLAVLSLGALSLGALVACGGDGNGSTGSGNGETRRVAFVSNGVDPFWNICAAGARITAAELGIECEVVFPNNSAEDQRQKLEDLLIRGVDGIAVSPVDAAGLDDLLNRIAKEVPLITQDADAPASDRRCFIGVDNYAAGRNAGDLVKEALPDGGSVVIFVGRLEQQNARERRQGVIDALLDRDPDRTRFDAIGSVPKGGKYEVLDTRVDNFDVAQAKSNAEDALTTYPELGAMVGLFAYNPPTCVEALRGADKLGEVKIIGFDEQTGTLEGIAAGHIFATVSQDPFRYGEESVRVLNAILDGDESVIPESGWIEIISQVVRKENVEEFRSELEARLKRGA